MLVQTDPIQVTAFSQLADCLQNPGVVLSKLREADVSEPVAELVDAAKVRVLPRASLVVDVIEDPLELVCDAL